MMTTDIETASPVKSGIYDLFLSNTDKEGETSLKTDILTLQDSTVENEVITTSDEPALDMVTSSILEDAQSGKASAFETIYALLQPDISRYVRRMIGSPQAVEDIVQDTFISLYLNIDKVQSVEHLRPYVYRIARNNSYDLLREWGRREHISVDDETPQHQRLMFDISDQNHTPEDSTHWLLMLVEVQALIDNLPDQQRETLILYSEQGMTYAEIAEVMDVSMGTVKSRLFHAKRTLRGMVNPDVLISLQSDQSLTTKLERNVENTVEHSEQDS